MNTRNLRSCVSFIFYLLQFTTDGLDTHPQTAKSMAFEDIVEGKKLVDSLIENFVLASETKCGLACNRNYSCRSFNFCIPDRCELNVDDIYSTTDGSSSLVADATCKYFGMKRQAKPVCQKHGQFAEIQNNEQNEGCQTDGKRVDREWSSWILLPVIDEPTEWKKIEEREIVLDAAHGGKVGNDSSRTRGMWLKFGKEPKTWSAARDHCVDIGGKLFSDVDGTREQLRFLLDKMDDHTHYLGIYREDHVNWKDIDGKVIDNSRLVWGQGRPTNMYNNYNVALNTQNGIYDYMGSFQYWFVCDMMT